MYSFAVRWKTMMVKTAICSCPIKFAKCVLLLEAKALNYSVDYYHPAASVYPLIHILFNYIMRLAGKWDKIIT